MFKLRQYFQVFLGFLAFFLVLWTLGKSDRSVIRPQTISFPVDNHPYHDLPTSSVKSHHLPLFSSDVDWGSRREQVRQVFLESWLAYETYAWGYDEFYPISMTHRQMVPPTGLGWIIVDSLDTLILMNLTEQLSNARKWISTTLTYDLDHDVNTFETTIRMLGGLLGAHYLSTLISITSKTPSLDNYGDNLYIKVAEDLARRLLGAYNSPSGIPYASVNLRNSFGIPSHADFGASSTAEAATLQLEMKYLSFLTGDKIYWDKAEKVFQVIKNNNVSDGLVPIFIDPKTGKFMGNLIRLGSRGDSYYEYLAKLYLQTSKRENVYHDMWETALQGVRKHLLTYSYTSNLTVIGERETGLDGELSGKMDHLVCFLPGTIALSATGGKEEQQLKQDGQWTEQVERDMNLARELIKTCWSMYKVTITGLAPEVTHFKLYSPPIMYENEKLSSIPGLLEYKTTNFNTKISESWRNDIIIKPTDRHNLQRPETVESLFYMWRITKDEMYRKWGWEMFQSFVKHSKVRFSAKLDSQNDQTIDGNPFVPGGERNADQRQKQMAIAGYTSLNDVTQIPASQRDNMESFWLSETLKYMYLLFSDDSILPLNETIFNTEAHPFPMFEAPASWISAWSNS